MELRLLEFEKNILLWYPFKENSSLLTIGLDVSKFKDELDVNFNKIVDIENVKENDKFDYITIIDETSVNIEQRIDFATKYLKEDGKVLLAINNKFGASNLNTTSSNINAGISQADLEDIISNKGFNNSKFYYVFPNYKYANLIYTDEYELTEEDISRNFAVYEKEAVINFYENKFYTELLKEGKKFVNKFANSFFIELSYKEIDTDIKYVSYSNYRKKEYRVMTIIGESKVIKKAADIAALKHINQINENLEALKKYNVDLIENFEKNKFVSNFIKTERFDVELSKVDNLEEFIKKIDVLKAIYEKETINFEDIKESDLKLCIRNYDKEKLKKLHFVKKAYIDLIPKNIFIVNGRIKVFDQEWVEANIPLEYIYYRLILNTPVALNRFGKKELFDIFNLSDYIDLFKALEEDLRNKTFDMEMHDIFFRSYSTLKEANQKISSYLKFFPYIKDENLKLEKQNHDLNLELNDARNKVVGYANQLRVIEASKTWKILNLFRKIVSKFRFKRNTNNEKKEIKDRKQAILEELDRILDNKTKKYWLELAERYKKIRNKIENTTETDNTYILWMKANDCNEEKYRIQVKQSEEFAIKPKISILVPLYNTPIDFFRELLFAVYFQSYPNWELCLADGSPEPLKEIEDMCKDPRVKYYYIGENKGISGNTNECLKLATGDYIALFDHDDMIPLNSLFEIVRCINNNPEVEFIYTDEDKMESVDEFRYNPYFKPDYSPDTLRSGNYITHFSIFKRELMDKLDGFRSKYDGAQDFDIILRATELAGKDKIKHIPSILYHWRTHALSTALNSDAKTYAYDSGVLAIEDHLKRIGLEGKVTANPNLRGYYQVSYEVKENPKVNIYIINKYIGKAGLSIAIDSIINNTTYKNYEIDVIDITNGNMEIEKYYKEIIAGRKAKVLYYNGDLNYSKIMNYAIKNTEGDYIVEYNILERIDTKDWIEQMLGLAQREDVGIVGGKIVYSDNLSLSKHIGITYGVMDFAKYINQKEAVADFLRDRYTCNVSCVTSLFRMYKRKVFNIVNGMDEKVSFDDINEVDFSLSVINAGFTNVYCPEARVIDFIDETIKPHEIVKNSLEEYEKNVEDYKHYLEVKYLKNKWKTFFDKNDPYYNVNFNPKEQRTILKVDEVKY